MAGKDNDPDHLIYEVADLWFHSMVALSQAGLRPEQVLMELQRREDFGLGRESLPQGLEINKNFNKCKS